MRGSTSSRSQVRARPDISAAILTGGSIERIEINPRFGGACYTYGGSRFVTLSAGYLGSMFFGAVLLTSCLASTGCQQGEFRTGLEVLRNSGFAELSGRLEREAEYALARILDEQHPLERVTGVREHDLGKVLRGRIDRSHDRDPVHQRFPAADEGATHEIRREYAGDQQQNHSQYRAQPGNVDPENLFRPVLRRQQQQ